MKKEDWNSTQDFQKDRPERNLPIDLFFISMRDRNKNRGRKLVLPGN